MKGVNMKKLFVLLALPLAFIGFACGKANSTSYPAYTVNTNTTPLSTGGKTVKTNNHSVINGTYSCTLSNTGLISNGATFAPTFPLAVNGKSDATATAWVAETINPATANLFGKATGTISGYTFSGTTSKNGALNITFSFTPNANGYDDISATGTVVLNGNDIVTNLPYSKTANITCSSVWKI